MKLREAARLGIAVAAAMLGATPVGADIMLSELIVDLQPARQIRDDIEVWNNSPDRTFVAVEPREIVDPSLSTQTTRQDPDPEKLGILVAPARMILEPGQRKLIRIAAINTSASREHVYRVTVKPVAGPLQSNESGLKIMVGYDVLVLVRPTQPVANVTAVRNGRRLKFDNKGNVSVELVDGRQCAAGRSQCTDLPGKRLYSGASWTVDLPGDQPAEYTLKSPGRAERRTF
jgi:P pilus assembly chaperone PapD